MLLEFSVDQLGRVQNPQVLDAQPTSGFNKAAISAVSRYTGNRGVKLGIAWKTESQVSGPLAVRIQIAIGIDVWTAKMA